MSVGLGVRKVQGLDVRVRWIHLRGDFRLGSRAVDPLPWTKPQPCYRLPLSCGPAPAAPTNSRSVPAADLRRCTRCVHKILLYAHSITSSARASSAGGVVRPRTLAVLRFMTSSNFVGNCTGRSAGWAPLRI